MGAFFVVMLMLCLCPRAYNCSLYAGCNALWHRRGAWASGSMLCTVSSGDRDSWGECFCSSYGEITAGRGGHG